MKIVVLGTSFDTGNLGVSALAESSVKLLMNRWPDCDIVFAGSGYEPKTDDVIVGAKRKKIISIPVRFSKNIFHKCHFLRFILFGILKKLGFKTAGNEYFKTLGNCDLVCDITGGDSFSDIYGFKRFLLGFLTKWMFIFLGKDLVMLPQTYGPFKKNVSKKMAAYILRKAKTVYSRDRDGIECVCRLLKGKDTDKVKLRPDVAFVLDLRIWEDAAVEAVDNARKEGRTIVGLNISGLLYNGGYTRDNMFGLAVDYPKLIRQIVDYFLTMDNVTVVLVPHVFPADALAVESDPAACRAVYESLTKQQQGKVILPDTQPDQGQVKYLIGRCGFFVGSRMHSCIAAMSQCVPVVGLAYSKKFHGVFETAGLAESVIDITKNDNDSILQVIDSIFRQSGKTNTKNIMSDILSQCHNLF